MKTVLVVINTETFGGPHNQTVQMNQALRELGWRQVVVCPEGLDDLARSRFKEAGIEYRLIKIVRFRKFRFLWSVFKYFREYSSVSRDLEGIIEDVSADVVQCCGLMNSHPITIARKIGKPVVWQWLSNFAPELLRGFYVKLFASRVASIMTTGKLTANQHPGAEGFSYKIVPFYPPVKTKEFQFTQGEIREGRRMLGVADGRIVVGTVGNQNRQKRHEDFVELSMKSSNRSEISWRIVGRKTLSQEKYYQREVVSRAQKAGIEAEGNFKIIDPMGEAKPFLAGMDIFVMTSFAEGVPTAALEAMASGIPVVSTRAGGLEEVVEDGVNGFVHEIGDVPGLLVSIEKLVGNAELREEFGRKARERAQQLYDVSRCAEVHVRVYEDCCSKFQANLNQS
jgi:glycosyltransferase involved in cell wall biosynthesis